MNYVEHYLTIDLTRERVSGCIIIGERNVGHRLHVRLSEGVVPYTLPEIGEGIVQFVYELPSGSKSDVGMTVADNEAVCVIPAAALQAPGDVNCEVRVYTTVAGTWTTTAQFVLDVQDAIYDAEAMEELESDPTVYEQIVASEAGRVAAEALRVSAEDDRTDAEAGRVSAEAARVLAEEARAAAEEARAAAEEARQAANYITHDEIDATPTANSENVAQSGGVYTALEAKQDKLTFDNSPTLNSDNPVKSSGIRNSILDNKGIYVGRCYTAADVRVKEVAIQNTPYKSTSLPKVLVVWFQNGNSYNSSSTRLQITGTVAQVDICLDKTFNTSPIVTNYDASNAWQAGEIVTFVYDGYNYILQKRLATSSVLGMVKLSDAVDSTAQDTAASSKAVKTAYDLAASKANPGDIPTISKSSTVASDITDDTKTVSPKAMKTWVEAQNFAAASAIQTVPDISKSSTITSDISSDTKTVSPKAMKTWVDAQGFALVSQIPEAFSLYVCGTGEYDTTTGVPTLQSPDNHHLYLTPNGTSYREYVYTGTAYELVGDTTVDLSNYVQTTDLVAYTETEIANLWNAASAST